MIIEEKNLSFKLPKINLHLTGKGGALTKAGNALVKDVKIAATVAAQDNPVAVGIGVATGKIKSVRDMYGVASVANALQKDKININLNASPQFRAYASTIGGDIGGAIGGAIGAVTGQPELAAVGSKIGANIATSNAKDYVTSEENRNQQAANNALAVQTLKPVIPAAQKQKPVVQTFKKQKENILSETIDYAKKNPVMIVGGLAVTGLIIIILKKRGNKK